MSNRAYRCEIKHVENETFNCWWDDPITEWLRDNTDFNDSLFEGPTGVSFISVKNWQKLLKDLKGKLSKDRIKSIKTDLKWAKENKKDYISYYIV